MNGIELIHLERSRQVACEGFSPEHDDEHTNRALIQAALCYIKGDATGWPWEPRWWKPKSRVRNLVKAGALIAAEIDRLQRKEAKAVTKCS